MTHDEFAARYQLRSKLRAEGVESWDAVRTSTDQPVLVHRLLTSTRQRVLEMIEYLEPAERARIVERCDVDEVPVVVTEPLPSFTTFVEWLQKGVPATVNAPMRALRRPARDAGAVDGVADRPQDPTPTERATDDSQDGGGLTHMFFPSESERLVPRPPPSVPAPSVDDDAVDTGSFGPLEPPEPGSLTSIFLPTEPVRSSPPSLAARGFLDDALVSAPPPSLIGPNASGQAPKFRPAPQVAPDDRPRVEDAAIPATGAPDFRDAFVSSPEPTAQPIPHMVTPEIPLPRIDLDTRSEFDQIVGPRGPAGSAAAIQPDVIGPSGQTRKPSILPVVIAGALLLITLVAVLVFLALRG